MRIAQSETWPHATPTVRLPCWHSRRLDLNSPHGTYTGQPATVRTCLASGGSPEYTLVLPSVAAAPPTRAATAAAGTIGLLRTLAISGYRSLFNLVMPLAPLTVITGDNGSGKSNLYRALRLLADAARGEVVPALARQGGLPSTLWAGPERPDRAVERGELPLQGGPRRTAVRLRLGFAGSDFGYLVELGYPTPSRSMFDLDPAIKREVIWTGAAWRSASSLVDRKGALLRRREGRHWQLITRRLAAADSLFSTAGDPTTVPEVFALRSAIQGWRFYSDLRTDSHAPARLARTASSTPVLRHDGADLAAALQTIREIGDGERLAATIDDAFEGSVLHINSLEPGRLKLALAQPGLLRAMDVSEWSDGTLRYLLLAAALLTPRPPELMVLNEPETSLHPDLLPALARLIIAASEQTQIWIITHSQRLANALACHDLAYCPRLVKVHGRTEIAALGELDKPVWRWPGG